MKNFILIVFIFFVAKCPIKKVYAAYRCTPGSKLSPPSILLKSHLFCSYDKDVRPVDRKDKAVTVYLQLMPKFMDFESRTSTFTLHYWYTMKWTDDHLNWIPGEFEEVKKLYVKSDEIWTPDMIIVNSGKRSELPLTPCIVTNNGNVTCVFSIKSSVSCNSDFTYWPYDEQYCRIRTGSGTYYTNEVDFQFINSGITMEDFTLNHEWLLTRQVASATVLSAFMINYTEVNFKFDIKRHSSLAQSCYIIPIAILVIFTMSVLLLDSKSKERITLASVNFVCHLFCIYHLHWMVPLNGMSIPHILVFYRDSMVLAAFALIMTIVFRKLQMISAKAPNWIASFVSILEDYRLTRFLVTNDQESKGSCRSESETEDNVESVQSMNSETNKDETWSRFANFFEWMTLFSIFLTYLVLLATLIPKVPRDIVML